LKLKSESALPTLLIGSPLGQLSITAGSNGLCSLTISADESCQERLALEPEPVLSAAAVQLHEYFTGQRTVFDLPLDFSALSGFTRQVLMALQTVPFATTVSYGDLAAMVGKPRAARAVGRVMAINPLPLIVPCHRVVGRNGDLVGYSGGGGLVTKEWLLAFELKVVAGTQVG